MNRIVNNLGSQGLMAGIVIGRGVAAGPAPQELSCVLQELLVKRSAEIFPPADLKEAVRTLLRTAAFKPTGRSKPASEYLAQAAREGRFPLINNLVDINNYLSLLSGLPISLLDMSAVGDSMSLRHGRVGERYVFNEGGQEIDLNGLICACREQDGESRPLGNPVKDSMEGKIKAGTQGVIGVIYAPSGFISRDEMEKHLGLFCSMLQKYGAAKDVERRIA